MLADADNFVRGYNLFVFLKCVGILIGSLFLSKLCVGLLGIISYDTNLIDSESKNVVYRARDLADFLCLVDETHTEYFEYNTAFYEELFFLCCIEAAKLIKNKKDIKLYKKIKNKAFNFSNILDGIKKYNTIKNVIDDTFKQRSMFYMSLINTYNYNLNNDFFSAAFDYQKNIFAIGWKNKPKNKEKIRSILEEALPAFKEFYNSYY